MYKIVITNRNGRVLREISGVELPENTEDMSKVLEFISMGAKAACGFGFISVYNELDGNQIAEKIFVAKK